MLDHKLHVTVLGKFHSVVLGTINVVDQMYWRWFLPHCRFSAWVICSTYQRMSWRSSNLTRWLVYCKDQKIIYLIKCVIFTILF